MFQELWFTGRNQDEELYNNLTKSWKNIKDQRNMPNSITTQNVFSLLKAQKCIDLCVLWLSAEGILISCQHQNN